MADACNTCSVGTCRAVTRACPDTVPPCFYTFAPWGHTVRCARAVRRAFPDPSPLTARLTVASAVFPHAGLPGFRLSQTQSKTRR